MIIVTGSVTARPETVDEVLALCLAHVERSRLEPGCLLHTVHRDVEDPLRAVFLERWADRSALAAHFAVPASARFVRAVSRLASGPPALEVYEAEPVDLALLGSGQGADR
jgi:quinol monooxygenase YgiN